MLAYISATILCPNCNNGMYKYDNKLMCIHNACPQYHVVYHAPTITLQPYIPKEKENPIMTNISHISHMSNDEPVAITIPHEHAKEILNRTRTLRKSYLTSPPPPPSVDTPSITFIVKPSQSTDPLHVAEALTVALGVVIPSNEIHPNDPIPSGWEHVEFLDPDPSIGRHERKRKVKQSILPILFTD